MRAVLRPCTYKMRASQLALVAILQKDVEECAGDEREILNE